VRRRFTTGHGLTVSLLKLSMHRSITMVVGQGLRWIEGDHGEARISAKLLNDITDTECKSRQRYPRVLTPFRQPLHGLSASQRPVSSTLHSSPASAIRIGLHRIARSPLRRTLKTATDLRHLRISCGFLRRIAICGFYR
jgi:hypothetical protein